MARDVPIPVADRPGGHRAKPSIRHCGRAVRSPGPRSPAHTLTPGPGASSGPGHSATRATRSVAPPDGSSITMTVTAEQSQKGELDDDPRPTDLRWRARRASAVAEHGRARSPTIVLRSIRSSDIDPPAGPIGPRSTPHRSCDRRRRRGAHRRAGAASPSRRLRPRRSGATMLGAVEPEHPARSSRGPAAPAGRRKPPPSVGDARRSTQSLLPMRRHPQQAAERARREPVLDRVLDQRQHRRWRHPASAQRRGDLDLIGKPRAHAQALDLEVALGQAPAPRRASSPRRRMWARAALM